MTEGVFRPFPTSQSEIEELRQLELDASKAPWVTDPPPGSSEFRRRIDRLYQGGSEIVAAGAAHNDANLIVLVRNMLPRLLATLDQHRYILERLRDGVGLKCDGERFTWFPDPVTGAPVRRFSGCNIYRNGNPADPEERCLSCEAEMILEQMDAWTPGRLTLVVQAR